MLLFRFARQDSNNFFFFFFISVLQECTTDSEELIYPVRAPSSCSAPPDLLLTSEREQFSVRNPHLINKNADSTKTPKSVKSEQERVRLEVITCCSFIFFFFVEIFFFIIPFKCFIVGAFSLYNKKVNVICLNSSHYNLFY